MKTTDNRKRMQQLISEISDMEYHELAEVLNDTLLTCPNFAAQTIEANEFLGEIAEALHGLSFKYLEKFAEDQDQLIHAKKISAQAAAVMKCLYISGGEMVMLANATQAA